MAEAISVEELQAQLSEKEAIILALKEKTKSYVAKLKDDHSAALELEKQYNQLLHEQLDESNKSLTPLKRELETVRKREADGQVKMEALQTELTRLTAAHKEELEKLQKENETVNNVMDEQMACQQEDYRALSQTAKKLESDLALYKAQAEGNEKELTLLQTKIKRLEEEKVGLRTNSIDTIDLMTKEITNLKDENFLLKAKLASTAEELSRKETSLNAMAVRLDEAIAHKDQLQDTISHQSSEEARTTGEEAGELIVLRTDLQAKIALIATMRGDMSGLQEKIHELEKTRSSLEASKQSLLQQKEELSTQLRSKESALASTQQSLEEKEQQQRTSQLQNRQRIQELGKELESIKMTLAVKTTEQLDLQSQLSAVQNQNHSLEEELLNTKNMLKSEVAAAQDRKKKVKEYVATLTSEKQALQSQLAELQERLSDAQATRSVSEFQQREQEKLIAELKEQLEREKQQLACEYEASVASLQEEADGLKRLVEMHSRGATDEVREAYRQMELANKELEAHKAKRLTARSEMIGMAQALEKSQKEGEELKTYLQYTLAPLVFEQINTLETLLMAVELASNLLNGKRAVRFQLSAGDYLRNNCCKSQNEARNNKSLETSSNSRNKFYHPSNGGNAAPAAGARGGVAGKIGKTAASMMAEAMDQADMLRRELERLQSGLTLLTQSTEKLTEVINVDTRCCGPVYDVLFASMGWPSARVPSMPSSIHISRPKGYDRVVELSGNDDSPAGLTGAEEDSFDVGVANGINSSSSNNSNIHNNSESKKRMSTVLNGVTSILHMSPAKVTSPISTANHFTIESCDDDMEGD